MEFGLLWLDSDAARPLEDKIDRAARRYREKYGREPNTCYIHAGASEGQPAPGSNSSCRLDDPKITILVLGARNVPLHHLWLGERRKKATTDGANEGD
jgi:hypothetical protein